MTLIFRSATVTDVGLVRTNNEDRAHAGRWLIAVADGMGGAPAGEVASELAIAGLAALDSPVHAQEAPPVLRAAAEAANRRIAEVAAADQSHEGMGTTLTALLLAGTDVALLHVGDSRCYRWRAGELAQLTRDDTFVQALVDRGVLTSEEARRHPQRSLVTNAVQGEPLRPTASTLDAVTGDRLLVCSDGLSDVVADEAIASALASFAEPHACAEGLVKLALQGGGPDNVTVVIADVVDDPAA